MTRHALLSLLRAAATLFLLLSLSFLIMRASGDPAVLILSPDSPKEMLDAFRERWGLTGSLASQYLDYLRSLACGRFGASMLDGRPAIEVVAERLPPSILLAGSAFLLKLGIGVPLGLFAATRKGAWVDHLVLWLSGLGYAIPNFIMALLLVLVFSIRLRLLPSGGGSGLNHLILPTATIALGGSALLARFTRAAMLEVLDQPYIRSARLRGLSWPVVILRHAVPNAAIPLVTVIGMMIGNLIVSTVVVESAFGWPGIGRLLITSIANRDIAIVQTILLLVGCTMIVANLAVDFAYGLLDPRVLRPRAS
ncbi:ABC transporter permease [Bradyrhizobium valentinum]|uniref:ABC transporter permease n=1 Tax=Bradyrhizobium valentinum TaxID=1518501 RepID=UPI00070B8849|nr:ABC transporter permease [Bradyrhizobium valentinum]KRQ95432.1 ABC transporter permease [Bradyrhizobium valentinum]